MNEQDTPWRWWLYKLSEATALVTGSHADYSHVPGCEEVEVVPLGTLAELVALREESRERPMSERPADFTAVLLFEGERCFAGWWNGRYWVDDEGCVCDAANGWRPMPTPKGGKT
jgi:hypothetical protein